jgi:Zn-finger nucleic acid-binding protein
MPRLHAPFCPRCRDALTPGKARNVTLHACGHCGGVWVDPVCADRMLDAYEADALLLADRIAQCAAKHTDTSHKRIPCAVCDAPMRVRHLHGVDIDHCDDHGTWFDAHELRTVADAQAQVRRGRFQQSAHAFPAPVAVTAAAATVAAVPPDNQRSHDVSLLDVGDAVEVGLDVADLGLDVGADAVDIAGAAVEIVGGILGGLFEL